MNYIETGILQKQKVWIKNLLPEIGIEQARQEIVSGLLAKNPFISSKFFYDENGSMLFEEITQLNEYYPTRVEKEILEKIAPDLMNRKSSFEIIELGSGDCSKISILLNAVENQNLNNLKYIPVDFSRAAIKNSGNELSENFPELEINGYVADFIHQMDLIPHSEKPRIICFLGSTIGNFLKKEAQEIIIGLSKGILEDDILLVGFDLVKSESILHTAYNDSKGVTEKFNKNILNVVNTIVKTDFNQNDFEHLAFFNKEANRIEMYLEANKDCEIYSPYLVNSIQFKRGDVIHTENSHKYSRELVHELIVDTGLTIKNSYKDSRNWFVLVEFERSM